VQRLITRRHGDAEDGRDVYGGPDRDDKEIGQPE
jgi:hypothetical protein